MTSPSWPEAKELRALCRLLSWQVPLPRQAGLQLVRGTPLAEVHLPVEIPASEVDAMERNIRCWRDRCGGSILLFHAPAFPPLLREIARPPAALFVQGNESCLLAPAVAIVGARAAARSYRTWTRDVARSLSRCGVTIASGMARGIDAAAHEGALEAGGRTFAIVGAGCDVPYPAEHAELQERIEDQGCVASELPPGTPPRRWNFPSRNRILAGLVRAVLVVQAEPRSGALITARFALHENREVMAVPGDVHDPRSRGVHALLRQGAVLVENAGDVLRGLGWERGVPETEACCGAGGDPAALLSQLSRPASVETLRSRLQWEAARLQQCLLELELAGLVERNPGGTVCRVRAC